MIRFGVSGLGRIGRRHAEAIKSIEGAKLVGIADPEIGEYGDTPVFRTLAEMVQKMQPDVVCICTPNHHHATQTRQALDHDCHVVCEKPLTLSYKEATQLVALAKSRDLQLTCVLQNRYSPQVQWLKGLVSNGRLGDILQVQVNCLWNRDDRYFLSGNGERHSWHGREGMDGGPLFTQFSHFVDLLVWLFGSFEVSNGMCANFTHKHSTDYEDTGKFDIRLPGGGFGVFQYSIAVWDRNQESSITLVGSKGSVKMGGQYMNSLEYAHFEGFETPNFDHPSPLSNHTRVLQNMVDVLNGVTDTPDFDVRDAIEGVRIIENVYALYDATKRDLVG